MSSHVVSYVSGLYKIRVDRAFADRVPGDTLNTRASGYLFLEMHLGFYSSVFPILSLSVRCPETRADKGTLGRQKEDAPKAT